MYGRTTKILYEKVLHWRRSTHISYTIRQFYVKSKEAGEVCRKILHTYICRHSHLHLLLLKWFYALKCYLFIPQAAEIKFLQKLFFFYCREWKQTREWWRERTKKNMKNQMEKFFLSDVSWKKNWRQLRRKKIYIL